VIPLHQAETKLPEFVRAVNQLIEGMSNASGEVTLTANATTTTVTSEVVTTTSKPQLTAAGGTWTSYILRVSAVAAGSFTITHANEAATDRVVFWRL